MFYTWYSRRLHNCTEFFGFLMNWEIPDRAESLDPPQVWPGVGADLAGVWAHPQLSSGTRTVAVIEPDAAFSLQLALRR
jgi:hypothetical protein